MTFVDTNVIIDVFERDPTWFPWSAAQIADASLGEGGVINPIVIAELGRNFDSLAALNAVMVPLALTSIPLDDGSAFLAGRRFQTYRRTRTTGEDGRVLPDFLIGAHALSLDLPLLTRDARLYRKYFPELSLITPETTSHG